MAISNSDFRVRNGIVVADNANVGGNLSVTSNVTAGGTLAVSGSGHTISGNTNHGTNTLHVNHVNKRVVVNAAATSTASSVTDWAFEVKGKTNISSNLNVEGPTNIANTLAVANNVAITGNVNVTGALSTLNSNAYIQGANIHFNTIGGSTTAQSVQVNGKLIVKGKYVSDSGNEYDLDDLAASVGSVPIIKIYNAAGTQVFP
jgi:hypothetical protein